MTPADAASLRTRILADAEGWTSSLFGKLTEYRQAGLSDDVIRDRLKADIDSNRGGLGSLPVGARAATTAVQARVYTGAAYAQHQPDDLLVWHAVGSNTCPDCISRSGQIATLADWTSRGLPRRGATVCGSRCRCVLLTIPRAARLYGVGKVDESNPADLRALTTEIRRPIELVQARIQDENLSRSAEARALGNFRQPDARRGGDSRTAATSDPQVTEAKLADAALRAAGRNPLDPMDVGRADYARQVKQLRRARVGDIMQGKVTDVDRVMGATPQFERGASVDALSGEVLNVAEGVQGKVDIPPVKGALPRSVSVTHFHPNGSALSTPDVVITMFQPQDLEIRAVSGDGTVFVMQKDGRAADIPQTPAAVNGAGQELDDLYRQAFAAVRAADPTVTGTNLLRRAGRIALSAFAKLRQMLFSEVRDG